MKNRTISDHPRVGSSSSSLSAFFILSHFLYFMILLSWTPRSLCHGFTNVVVNSKQPKLTQPTTTSSTKTTSLAAATSTSITERKPLTDRQRQFWNDVDTKLEEMERFYQSKGMDIDRIRTFTKRARGELPLPTNLPDGQEQSEEHVDGLTAKPYWDVVGEDKELFPWATKLEDQADIIVKEYEDKLGLNQQELFSADSAWQNQVMGTGWSAIRLQRLGKWNMDNCRDFPQTYELLKKLDIPLAVRGVCFARQLPQTGVQPHSDGRNFILTSHLGIRIPENDASDPLCWIQVGNNDNDDNKRTWQKGKLVTIDTSFIHSTKNNSLKEDRHVLIIDYWHPELTEAERTCLAMIYDLRNQYDSGKIPYRPTSDEGGGIGGWWQKLVGGGSNENE